MSKFTDIGVEKTGHVSTIEIRRPPLNFFDIPLINQIADALTDIDNDPEIRAVVLAAQGKAFCAGANFAEPANMVVDTPPAPGEPPRMGEISPLYIQAVRIFRNKKPIVAAVHGAAIGGVKVVTANGWFAARPSGTENIYKIYGESFKGEEHLAQILEEAQHVVDGALAGN